MPSKEDLRKFAAVYALERIPNQIEHDILADAEFITKLPLEIASAIPLEDGSTLSRDMLFDAFRAAIEGKGEQSFQSRKPKVQQVIASFEVDSAVGLFTVNGVKHRILNADLLARSKAQRIAAFERVCAQNNLSARQRNRLEERVLADDFADTDFLEIGAALDDSPEAFSSRLKAQVSRNRLDQTDIVPATENYWDNLLPLPDGATSLSDFLKGPLKSEWEARLKKSGSNAVTFLRRFFISPLVPPGDWLEGLPRETLLELLAGPKNAFEPYALMGCARLCLQVANGDPVVEGIGAKHLAALFENFEYLDAALELYGCVFMLSTAFLASHEQYRQRPVYWRRIAAAAHAACVVESVGPSTGKAGALFSWAIGISGMAFASSVLRDWESEPRWRPDWINGPHLFADVVGRGLHLRKLAEPSTVVPSWEIWLNKAEQAVQARGITLLCGYPCATEGEARPPLENFDDLTELGALYQNAFNRPTLRKFLMVSYAIHCLGVPAGFDKGVINILRIIARDKSGPLKVNEQNALALASQVAALTRSEKLAAELRDACVTKAVCVRSSGEVYALATAVIGAAGAFQNPEQCMAFQQGAFEQIALVIHSPFGLRALHHFLVQYADLDPSLRIALSRTIAIATLGASYLRAETIFDDND